jgi:ABC-type uncharacterized transport system involved in gliding motility auxiliary subunit
MQDEDKKKVTRGVWRQRGRRFATGLNVCTSIALAVVLTVMVNYLAYRHYSHWDVSWHQHYRLSDRTKALIASLNTDVDVMVFFQRNQEQYDNVRNLLKEYEYEAARFKPQRLRIAFVDPDRDLARTRELKQKFDLTSGNVVVFTSAGRTKYVDAKDTVEIEYKLKQDLTVDRKFAGFKGEQVFSSAIQSVLQESSPVVYFLTGHGERDIKDCGEQSGYSALARVIRRDNIELKTLQFAETRAIPDDCSALVIAGPEKRLSAPEIDSIASYLNKGGRLFLLIDPTIMTGLEKVLEDWNVKLGHSVVVGLTYTGDDLIITEYGNHPITKNLSNVVTEFFMPRSIELIETSATQPAQADQPRAVVLAANTKDGWAESDINQKPPRFDAAVDRRGPIPVAVAVERGALRDINVGIKPTRIVVIGDSYFVSNGGLSKAIGGNIDFFMSSMNWLVAREALLAIGPKPVTVLRLDMNRQQVKTAAIIILGAMPLAAALIGLMVWARRRQ